MPHWDNHTGPDKPDKGELHGSCNRTACQAPNALYYNQSTEKHYCHLCAEWLNTDTFNKADAQRMYGSDLCILKI